MNSHLPSRRDTIFAPASGVGRAAIAVIRLSGPEVRAAIAAIAPGPAPEARVATLRTLRDPETQEALDRALVLFFPAPNSFSGEDMAELQVTGGRAVLAAAVAALGKIPGLRPADPGEFALRAFENGKMDLSQVEGLADLVDAETAAQRRQALRIADGALSREADALRERTLDAMAALEIQIDFSDVDEADAVIFEAVRAPAAEALARIDVALASARAGERLREGLTIVIAGPPNAGKSTLMNALARRDVAIVSAIPGTTRDAIEVALDLDGYPVTLVDTAGLRETEDPLEREGIARARRRAASADLTLWLSDYAAPAPPPENLHPVLSILTKCDTPAMTPSPRARGEANPNARRLSSSGEGSGLPTQGPGQTPFDQSLTPTLSPQARRGSAWPISARTGQGLPQLLDEIRRFAAEQLGTGSLALISNARHRLAFEDARAALQRALASEGGAEELIAEDLRLAARALERIAGRIDVEDILGAIFSRLCVGK